MDGAGLSPTIPRWRWVGFGSVFAPSVLRIFPVLERASEISGNKIKREKEGAKNRDKKKVETSVNKRRTPALREYARTPGGRLLCVCVRVCARKRLKGKRHHQQVTNSPRRKGSARAKRHTLARVVSTGTGVMEFSKAIGPFISARKRSRQ